MAPLSSRRSLLRGGARPLLRRRAGPRRLTVVLAIALLAALACLVAAPAQAQTAPAALILASTGDLAFGRFVAGAGGAVTIAPGGMRSAAGGVILLPSSAGAARFHLDRSGGASAQAVSISLPAGRSVVLASGAQRMTVSAFQASPASIGSIADGGLAISVGATLEVAPAQPPGSYQGAFAVTVNYE